MARALTHLKAAPHKHAAPQEKERGRGEVAETGGWRVEQRAQSRAIRLHERKEGGP